MRVRKQGISLIILISFKDRSLTVVAGEAKQSIAALSIRHPEVRALASLEGRRPDCGRFILRGSLRSHLQRQRLCRCAGMTDHSDKPPRSRGAKRPDLAVIIAPRRNQRAQGMPDARCTRGLMCVVHKRAAHEHTGEAEASDIPCAMALRLTSRSPR